MALICALTEHGISSSDGRVVDFDLLAGSLNLLAEDAILRNHVCTDQAEIARSQAILYASLMILQSVAFNAGGVRLPSVGRISQSVRWQDGLGNPSYPGGQTS